MPGISFELTEDPLENVRRRESLSTLILGDVVLIQRPNESEAVEGRFVCKIVSKESGVVMGFWARLLNSNIAIELPIESLKAVRYMQ